MVLASSSEIEDVLFRAAATRSESVAIDADARSLTWAELESRVCRLSGWLRGLGACGRVAVLSGDPARAIPAMLGAMDAGWTYVPLDPGWPAARLLAVARAVAPDALLVDPALSDGVARALDGLAARRLGLDRLAELPAAAAARATAQGPSNIFFTSGTTGRPKGILGRPGAVAHYVRWEARLLGAGPGLRVSALAPTSFDASLRDACLPLSVGGTVCVPPDRGVFADGTRLAQWLAEARVQVVHTVPTVLRGLLAGAPSLPALRAVLVAGEAVRPSDVARFEAVFGQEVALYNLYGPTETTMTRLVHRLGAGDAAASSVPLGVPMDDAEVFIVDSAGRERGVMRPGEIVLRSPWASLGYLDQPEETARAFVPDLLGDGSPVPVYRTGDLGVRRADGLIEFRGRRDLQVKVRGVRVELEEVEAALGAALGVEAAAAGLRDGKDGEPMLVAWVVGAVEAAALRASLMATLPAAAVPSRVVVLDALPRLINGKVDRSALRLPDVRSSEAVSPRGPVESTIAAVLEEVLRCSVGATDDLFELGISSLQAVQALWRLNEAFGAELPIDLLYHARTVEALAAHVAAGATASGGEFEVAELARGEGPAVFWLPPAYGVTMAYRAIAEQLPGRASLGLELPRPLRTVDGQGAGVEALATAAVRTIRARQPSGPVTLVGWSFGGVLAFEVARQLGEREVARLVILDSAAPGEAFDFGAGDAEMVAMTARRAGHMFGVHLPLEAAALHGLTPLAMCGRLLDVAAEHGIPVSAALRSQALTVVEVREASMAAWRRYAPRAWPGRAWVVRASGAEADWTGGWDRLIDGPITRRVVAGTHVGMLDEPYVGAVVAAVREALEG